MARKISYHVQFRNGYHGIDLYLDNSCIEMIDSFRSKKQADRIARELNSLAERVNILQQIADHPWVKPFFGDGQCLNQDSEE